MAIPSAAPKRAREPKVWDKPNPNNVSIPAKTRTGFISKVYDKNLFEQKVPTGQKTAAGKDGFKWERCDAEYDDKNRLVAGIYPRVQIYVTFSKVKNAEGQPLVLSFKETLSDADNANLMKLMSAFLEISVEAAKKRDTQELVNLPCNIVTANYHGDNGPGTGATYIKSIAPIATEEEESSVVAPAASTSPTQVAKSAPFQPFEQEDSDESDESEAALDQYASQTL